MRRNHRIACKLVRIARMLVASVFRDFVKPERKTLVVTNYRYWPVAFAMPEPGEGGGIALCRNCVSGDVAFRTLKHKRGVFTRTSLGKMVAKEMDRWSPTARNFRIVTSNILRRSLGDTVSFGEACDFFNDCAVGGSVDDHAYAESLSREAAFGRLRKDYDVSEAMLEQVFGASEPGEEGGGLSVLQEGGFSISIDHEDFSDEEARSLVADVRSKLPESVRDALCYGKLEVRGKFSKNYIGDYTPSTDSIRLAGDKANFVETMVHELGHRWMYKVAGREQLAEFQKLYDNARGKSFELRAGDLMEFEYDEYKYIFVRMMGNLIDVKYADDGTVCTFGKKALDHLVKVNGEPVTRYKFPSNYSKRNFREFVAVCFEHFCMGTQMDDGLRAEVGKILENRQASHS